MVAHGRRGPTTRSERRHGGAGHKIHTYSRRHANPTHRIGQGPGGPSHERGGMYGLPRLRPKRGPQGGPPGRRTRRALGSHVVCRERVRPTVRIALPRRMWCGKPGGPGVWWSPGLWVWPVSLTLPDAPRRTAQLTERGRGLPVAHINVCGVADPGPGFCVDYSAGVRGIVRTHRRRSRFQRGVEGVLGHESPGPRQRGTMDVGQVSHP